jgi:hypothetical protein
MDIAAWKQAYLDAVQPHVDAIKGVGFNEDLVRALLQPATTIVESSGCPAENRFIRRHVEAASTRTVTTKATPRGFTAGCYGLHKPR